MTAIPHAVLEAYGSLPGSWRLEKLKFLAEVRNSNVDKLAKDDEEPVRLCNYTDVYYNDRITSDLEFMEATATETEIRRFHLRRGQVILTKDSESWDDIGIPALVTEDMPEVVCGYHLTVFEPGEKLDGGFLAWLCRSEPLNDQFKLAANGVTRYALGMDALKNAFAALPPLDVQRRIARFLDEKAARIDALIAKKRALLERLAEKRQAVITRAVTQGLDPHAPRRPSGSNGLGEIPAHWIVADLGYRYEVQLGRMLNAERADGEHLKPYLRVNDVQWDTILVEDLPRMDFPPEVQAHYRLQEGDLLVNEGGSYVGRSAIWRGELHECYYQKALHRLRPFDPASDTAEFLYFVMEMATKNGLFIAGGNQTTIDHLTAEKLRHYEFAFPPREEQELIALALRADTNEIGRASAMVTESIEMLEQYRSSLVTAAVTGQIAELLERSNAVETPPRREVPNAFKRAALAAHIADRLCDEPTFGRVKFQKVLHLCEMHAGAVEVEGNYFRQAAGPLDSRMMHSVHSQLKKQGWFDIEERGGARGYLYRRGAKIDAYRKHFVRYFEDRSGTIDELLALLAGMNTEQSEIVSTVYAAWNDLLLEGRDATPDAIVHLVLNEWAEEKRRIPEDRWRRAIEWMRAKGLVPRGTGAHTRQREA